jgi:hypothetical protein
VGAYKHVHDKCESTMILYFSDLVPDPKLLIENYQKLGSIVSTNFANVRLDDDLHPTVKRAR